MRECNCTPENPNPNCSKRKDIHLLKQKIAALIAEEKYEDVLTLRDWYQEFLFLYCRNSD